LSETYFVNDGVFEVGGFGLSEIIRAHPTPLYLYSGDAIRARYRSFTSLFPGFDVFYSFKANPNLAICGMLRSLGACADVSSLGELEAALRVGFKPENIAFVGPGKTDEDLKAAIGSGIYAIAAESKCELDLIDDIAERLGRTANVLLRINTLEKPISPEMMVGGPSKFGFDEETVVQEVTSLNLRYAKITGVHVYSASQVLDAGFLSTHLRYVMDLARRLSDEIGFDIKCIDFGGGFGVPYAAEDAELDLAPIADTAQRVRDDLARSYPGCRLLFEVGRFLLAPAGVFLTKALRVKHSRGSHFVITDGGMNHFSRPVFMRVAHPVRLLNKMDAPATVECNVAGPICTPVDISGRGVMLPPPEPDDIVGIFNAGAYGYTMSMINFMSLGWPAEVMIDGGKIHLVRKPRPARHLFTDQERVS
jgi:diaminopimelate decarboxylase